MEPTRVKQFGKYTIYLTRGQSDYIFKFIENNNSYIDFDRLDEAIHYFEDKAFDNPESIFELRAICENPISSNILLTYSPQKGWNKDGLDAFLEMQKRKMFC